MSPRGRPKKIINEVQAPVVEEQKQEVRDQLVDIIQSLASSVQKLSKDIDEIKGKMKEKEDQTLSFAEPVKESQIDAEKLSEGFLTSIPVNLLNVAKNVLGDKFKFRCEPSPDMPQFTFTVIVPSEYSSLKEGVDERSKVILNVLGANGVEEWCKLVRQNIVKQLGKNLPVEFVK